MAEPDFEAQLTRLYNEAPSFPDAELFAAQVGASLDRGWAMRRLFIGGAGIAAGLIAAFQLVTTRFSAELKTLSHNGTRDLSADFSAAIGKFNLIASTPASAEAMWLAAGLALLALGFAVTRMMEDF